MCLLVNFLPLEYEFFYSDKFYKNIYHQTYIWVEKYFLIDSSISSTQEEELFPFKASESLIAAGAAWICRFTVFHQIWKIFSHYIFKYFSSPHPCFSGNSSYTHIRPLGIVLQLTDQFIF